MKFVLVRLDNDEKSVLTYAAPPDIRLGTRVEVNVLRGGKSTDLTGTVVSLNSDWKGSAKVLRVLGEPPLHNPFGL